MLQTFKNAWKTKEIRGKLLFTALILVLYRIGTVIPVPFVDAQNFAAAFSGTILDYMNILSGGALGTATLFALGVTPYINASIIIQLLGVAFPKLGEMSKDESGKKKMAMITRLTTVGLAIVTGIGYFFLLNRENNGVNALSGTVNASPVKWLFAIVIVACYVAGASLIMWLGERINNNGIGNGISLILFANIVSELPSTIYELFADVVVPAFGIEKGAALHGILAIVFALCVIAILIAATVIVIYVTGSERRIHVQYAKKVVGRKMYGGQSSDLPIKLNMTGVMPVIFASSIVSLIPTILAFFDLKDGSFWFKVNDALAADGFIYPVVFFILIIAFTYFYTQITFNPVEVANNLKKQGGAIVGIRQGRPTAEFIRKILSKVTFVGALFLAFIAVIPVVAGPHIVAPIIDALRNTEGVGAQLAGKFTFGGTTLLIVVGVVLETFRELEAQLTMRNYKGFLN